MPSSAKYLPGSWAHRSYETGRLVGHLYMTLEGIFGVAVDVSSSLIILFTIFGAFLQFSGAGKVLHRFSFSAMGANRRAQAAPRARLLSARRPVGQWCRHHGDARFGRLSDAGQGRLRQERAGGLLAAGARRDHLAAGLGAAAFLIAEFPERSRISMCC